MHITELNFLDRLQRGDVKTSHLKEVMLTAPRIIDMVKFDRPELIAACLECYIGMYGIGQLQRYQAIIDFYNAAEAPEKPWSVQSQFDMLAKTVPNPSDLKDTYWFLLDKIADEARKSEAPRVIHWVMEQMAEPAFPYFTTREKYRRSARKHEGFWMRDDHKRPLSRPSKEDFFDHAERFLEYGIKNGDHNLSMRSAALIKKKYGYFFRQQTEGRGRPYMRLSSDGLKMPEAVQRGDIDALTYFQNTFSLLDKLDDYLGTSGTRLEFAKGHFMAVMYQDDGALHDLFKAELSGMRKAEKLAFITDRFNLSCNEDRSDYDISMWADDLFNCRHGHLLDRVLDVFDEWDQDHRLKAPTYRRAFLAKVAGRLEDRYEGKYHKGGFDCYNVEHDFHPALKWKEVARRLNIVRREFPGRYRPITLRNKAYFQIALTRAKQNGHADDYLSLMDMAERFDAAADKQRKAQVMSDEASPRGKKPRYISLFTRFWRDKVARSSRMVEAVGQFFERHYDGNDRRWARQDLSNLVDLTTNRERYYDRGITYRDEGRKMAKPRYTESLPAAFDILRTRLKKCTSDEERAEFIADIFGELEGRSYDYDGLKDTLRTIAEVKDRGAFMAAARFWFEEAAPHYNNEQKTVMNKALGECAFDMWDGWEDPSFIKGVMDLARSYDVAYARDLADSASGRGMAAAFGMGDPLQAMALVRLCPYLLNDEERDDVENNFRYNMLSEYMERLDANRDKWAAAGVSRVDSRHEYEMPPTNYDAEMYERLLPAMQRYGQLEKTNMASYHARKLAILFPTMNKASRYLHNHAHGKQPVHDACLFNLPSDGTWDKELWANLAIRWGGGALKWLAFAPQMEAAAAKMNEGKPRRDHFKLSECKPHELRAFAHEHCSYARKDEAPELSAVLFDNGVPEQKFEETFALQAAFNEAASGGDLPPRVIPEITIDGADIGHDEYRLETLPQGDVRNLWMGQYVNSCMHLANEGRELALAMFQEPHAAAYVICKKDANGQSGDIVASFHTWLSQKGNIVFNSWQPRTADFDFLQAAFVEAAAHAALAAAPKSVERVVLGQGRLDAASMPYEYIEGGRFDIFNKLEENGGEVNINGDHYTFDTKMGQFIIAARRAGASDDEDANDVKVGTAIPAGRSAARKPSPT